MSSSVTVPILSNAISVPAMFWQRAEINGRRTALWVKREGRYEPRTWRELAEDVRQFAGRLRACGVSSGDRVAQWSDNRYEWILADLAIQSIGAMHVPIHAPLTAQQALKQVAHCGAKIVLIEGPTQLEKLQAIPRSSWETWSWLAYQPCGSASGSNLRLFASILPDDLTLEAITAQVATLKSSTLATILYTSGTTGDPKGVVLSQGNLTSNVRGMLEAFDDRETDVRLGFLPLSHIFARTCDLYVWIGRGSEFALAGSRATVMDDLQLVAPTLLNGVPYFFERLYHRIVESQSIDKPIGLRELLGGKIRGCCSGGAALPDYVYDYFVSQEIPLLQGYGMTESSPVITVSTAQACRRGAVGRALPGVEVAIAADGEVITRGPHVMQGYWNDHEATAAMVRDEWLHTGDLGELDAEGYLRITGRKKEMIVLSSGKKVTPTLIESLLCRDPLIEQAMVAGENRRSLVALIVPNAAALKQAIRERRLWVWSKRRAVTHPRIRDLFRDRIAQQLAELSRHEQVAQFEILDRGFTLESGHLTPKATLCRDRIAADFRAELDALHRRAQT